MLSVEGLRVQYGGIEAVRGVDLNVGDGQVVGIIGANGAGKSSTLKAIVGAVRPTAGSVTWDGKGLVGRCPHDNVRDGIVFVPEGRGLFPNLSVLENLKSATFARRNTRMGMYGALEFALDLFPVLREREHQAAGSLSGGEQQMLSVARALVMKPRLLILDELSLGLAPIVTRTIYDVVKERNRQGLSVLLVEQHVPFLLEVAHHVYVMDRGTVRVDGPPDEVAARPELQASYLGGAPV